MASFYLTINDAVRAKIDELVESKGLDAKDYPYSSDAAISLNQLSAILGGSGNSQSIADSIGEVLKNVGESGGGDSSSGPVLEWEQLVGPEDEIYRNSNGFPAVNIDDFFGWSTLSDACPWVFLKMSYGGNTYYSNKPIIVRSEYTNTTTTNIYSTDVNDVGIECVATYNNSNSGFESVVINMYFYSNLPSDISIYGALVTGWNE